MVKRTEAERFCWVLLEDFCWRAQTLQTWQMHVWLFLTVSDHLCPHLMSLWCFCLRLSVIDESSFLSHSDISYDRTDDDVVRTRSCTLYTTRVNGRSHEGVCLFVGPGHHCDQASEVSSSREKGAFLQTVFSLVLTAERSHTFSFPRLCVNIFHFISFTNQ